MKPEQQFWQLVSNSLPGDKVRVENSLFNGMPDANICFNGVDIWLELKIAKPNGDVYIRREQKVWGLRRSAAGGRVYVMALWRETDDIKIWKYPVDTYPCEGREKQIVNIPWTVVSKFTLYKVTKDLFA